MDAPPPTSALTEDHVLNTAGPSIFEFMYGRSDVAAAVLRPVLDVTGNLIDVTLEMANDSWMSARAWPIEIGARGSDFYSGFGDLLHLLRRVYAHGQAGQLFDSGDGDDRVVRGVIKQVEWRLLPNGLIIETARDQTLTVEALEATGPILICSLPDEGPAFPQRIIAVNHAFAEMFLHGYPNPVPMLGMDSAGFDLQLAHIRDHVRLLHPDHDWDRFDATSFSIYARGQDVVGQPFTLEGSAYLRDFFIRRLNARTRIGIWVYRTAGANAIAELPEFAHARVNVIYEIVRTLSRPIAAHSPVLDDAGNLVDIELIWANDAFNSYRATPLEPGVLGSQSRVRFEKDLLPYLQRAWSEGEATQYFKFQGDDAETRLYRDTYVDVSWDNSLEIETIYSRTDDGYLLEWGDDVDTKMRLGSDMAAQRRAAIQAVVDSQTEVARHSAHEQLSRDLHDNILQDLFVTGLELNGLELMDSIEQRNEAVAGIREHLNIISANIRSIIQDSRRTAGDPLPARVHDVVREWNDASNTLITFTNESSVDDTVIERLPQNINDNFVVIAKEAVSNAVRHSGGTRVDVSLNITGSLVHLSVVDDGQGFDPRNTRNSGTLNLKARAAAIGGDLEISSSPTGVAVIVTAPATPGSI